MSNLDTETKHLPFIAKLTHVIENGELDFWEDRKNPPNLSVDQFTLVMQRVQSAANLKWVKRESEKGKSGRSGEDDCFKFNCEVAFGGIFEIETKVYFIKGYFFDKGNLKGVTIQSFREE
jgi:hypothetical protein